ncbi:MAG: hypothetical protein CL557_12645 [Alphaproteobacteria bacterium]|nr:hypothetical protein [Alphaproteobacteria bacterium]
MAFPTTNAATELPAINQILMACGQAPVTTLDETNPDVAIAYQTLLEVSREVQSEGWTFNKEEHYEMTPNTDDEIIIPTNVLQIDLTQSTAGDKHVVRRNGKLYDKEHHTNKWTDGAIEVDILWFFDWVDLPRPIQDYITTRAATVTSSRIVGDQTQYQILQQKEAYMRAMALEYETTQGDYSFFGHPDGAHPYVSYQPYKALIR